MQHYASENDEQPSAAALPIIIMQPAFEESASGEEPTSKAGLIIRIGLTIRLVPTPQDGGTSAVPPSQPESAA
jgi:hypothetical protein